MNYQIRKFSAAEVLSHKYKVNNGTVLSKFFTRCEKIQFFQIFPEVNLKWFNPQFFQFFSVIVFVDKHGLVQFFQQCHNPPMFQESVVKARLSMISRLEASRASTCWAKLSMRLLKQDAEIVVSMSSKFSVTKKI